MGADINEEVVTAHLSSLRERYDGFQYREREHRLSDEQFPEIRTAAEEGYIGAGYVWVVRTPDQAPPLSDSMDDSDGQDSERVLFVRHRGAQRWDLPGGGREDDESFEDAAVREVDEETAITCAVTDLLLVEREVAVADGSEDRLHSLWVYFGGSYRDGTISIQASELNGAAWFSAPPARLRETPSRVADGWFE